MVAQILSSDERIIINDSEYENSTMNRFLEKKDKNPQYNNDIQNKLLLLKENNTLEKKREVMLELLSFFEKIPSTKKGIEVFRYFLKHGATTIRELSKNIKGSHTYYYKIIEQFIEADVIEYKIKVKSGKKLGGAPCTVYGLIDCTETEVQRAVSRYLKSHTRLYATVEVLVQRTLQDVIDEEIQYRKIVNIAHNSGNHSRFHFVDVANEIAFRLQEMGVRVWR